MPSRELRELPALRRCLAAAGAAAARGGGVFYTWLADEGVIEGSPRERMKVPNADELPAGVPEDEHMVALLNGITRKEWQAARARLQRQLDELRVPGA